MKQTKEDRLIAEAIYITEANIHPLVVERMDRVTADLEMLAQTLNNPKTPNSTKAAIENFFYNLKDYPI